MLAKVCALENRTEKRDNRICITVEVIINKTVR